MVLVPVLFSSTRIGTFRPMKAVADAINPDRQIVVSNAFDLGRVIHQFRRARYEATRQALPLELNSKPVIINYGITPVRANCVRVIKAAVPDAFAIQIGRARDGYHFSDLAIALPHHEMSPVVASEILRVPSLPTSITDDFMRTNDERWSPHLRREGRKLVAVLVGGDVGRSKEGLFSAAATRDLIDQTRQAVDGMPCDLVLTTSRRTSAETTRILRNELSPFCADSYCYGDVTRTNPYPGYMACADAFIVTGDSISLLSEAMDTGKAVYGFSPKGRNVNADKEHFDMLVASGRVRPLPDTIDFSQSAVPYRVAETIVQKVQVMVSLRDGQRARPIAAILT